MKQLSRIPRSPASAAAPAPGPLAERMKERMRERGLSIRDVASAAGLPKSIVQRIASGASTKPDLDQLFRLATALEWDVATLIGAAKDAAVSEATPIEMTGPVEVGTYRIPRAPHERPARTIVEAPQPQDPRLRGRRLLAVPVADDQLAQIAPRGVIGLVAFVAAGEDVPLETGGVYLLYRQDPQGKIESTLRRLTIYPDRHEFALMSPDADLNARELISLRIDERGSGAVRIGGKFYGLTAIYC